MSQLGHQGNEEARELHVGWDAADRQSSTVVGASYMFERLLGDGEPIEEDEALLNVPAHLRRQAFVVRSRDHILRHG